LLYGSCGELPPVGMGLCVKAYEQFINTASNNSEGQYCNMSSSLALPNGPVYFYSNCTCDQLTPVTVSVFGYSCTVSGFYYDPAFGPAFLPDYPTTSPYVTSVGAVAQQFSSECNTDITSPEIYCQASNPSGFSGGGGFSSFQQAPAFQQFFIQTYLDAAMGGLPPFNTFNASNRGYPDVSFNGHNYVTSLGYTVAEEGDQPQGLNGIIQPVSGTSASSPAFAGMIARINDQLAQQGLPSLGYLNQLLYQMAGEEPTTFTDIVPQGINFLNMTVLGGGFTGCTQQYCCEYGFPITEGWDAGTGLGTPNYPQIVKYVGAMWKNKKAKLNN